MSLDKRLGVLSDPPTDSDYDGSPDLGEGNNPSSDENQNGRTAENMYREMRRRHEQLASSVESKFSTLEGLLTQIVTDNRGDASTAANSHTGSGNRMSVAELRAARDAEEDPARRQQIADLITDRIAEERAAEIFTNHERARTTQEAESAANQEALRRYPDLGRPGSPMYDAVNAALRTRPDADRPGVVLDIANEVAISMGVSPVQSQGNLRQAPSVARGRTDKPRSTAQDVDDADLGVISDDELDAIAARLAPAFKGGKMSDEHRKSVKAKDREVKEILRDFGPGAFAS